MYNISTKTTTQHTQWLSHVKNENTMLMQLLHDVRTGKETIQQEADLLINERNEIGAIKLEKMIETFDRVLSELPLGEKSTHDAHRNTHMIHQHKSDSVHTLMVNIARRCRAQQEKHIGALIEGIRDAEESFLNNEDISLKISELKHLADHSNHHMSSTASFVNSSKGGGGKASATLSPERGSRGEGDMGGGTTKEAAAKLAQ